MREILFKGKTIEEGKWIEGSLIIDEKDNYYIGKYIESKGNCSYYCTNRRNGKTLNRFIGVGFAMVDKDTVCEYTQLKGKNGKRIWENDIVNIEYPKITVKKCVIEYVGASFVGSTHADNWELDGYYDIEVIGNIFDDSELLTAERIGENERI